MRNFTFSLILFYNFKRYQLFELKTESGVYFNQETMVVCKANTMKRHNKKRITEEVPYLLSESKTISIAYFWGEEQPNVMQERRIRH